MSSDISLSDVPSQVPVILVGNKIDLRGGEVTNEALEDEIVPIMNEFKVRLRATRSSHCIQLTRSPGSRDMRGMLGQATIECVGGVLLCPEGRSASDCAPLR